MHEKLEFMDEPNLWMMNLVMMDDFIHEQQISLHELSCEVS
jgi:hypothetical protein